MGNWAQLLEELLVGVAERIPLMEDLIAFGGVCRSWRSVAIKQQNFKGYQQVPWFMLSEEEEDEQGKVKDTGERRFVSLTKGGMIRRTALPEARGKRCLETMGWFVTVSKDGEMSLLHPFSRVEIPLPHINTFKNYIKDGMINNFIFIRKAVLSSSPDSLGKNNDYVLMVSYGGCGWLGFWRPGDKTWTTIESRRGAFSDISYYNGKFYGVDLGGCIFACDIGGPNETVAEVVGTIPREFMNYMRPYLVESDGVLLVVVRDGTHLDFLGDYGDDPNADVDHLDESRIDYGAEEFRVLEVDLNNAGGGWREKKSLGAKAVFLGDNASISVEAFPGIKANCIYYTDDCWESYQCFKRGGGKDMGIYNLEDESQTPFYKGESFSPICPPIWVNPSF